MNNNGKNEELTLSKDTTFDNKGGSILGILEGPVADFVHPTRNGRLYNEELWEKVLNSPLVKEQFKNGGIPGELDHPADRDDICSDKIAVLMTEPPIKRSDGEYWGRFNILNTPCGKIVYTLAKAGFKLGVSSRGTGETEETYDGNEEVDPDSYDFTCFDVVLLPAVKTARMNLITEGLDKKYDYKRVLKESLDKANDKDKQIMEKTLNDLHINLDESSDNDNNVDPHTLDLEDEQSIKDIPFVYWYVNVEFNGPEGSSIYVAKTNNRYDPYSWNKKNNDYGIYLSEKDAIAKALELKRTYHIDTVEYLDSHTGDSWEIDSTGNVLKEDTIKKSDGKWTNKGKEGEHGEFRTKKAADAQRKAMFANGYHENLDNDKDGECLKEDDTLERLNNIGDRLDGWIDSDPLQESADDDNKKDTSKDNDDDGDDKIANDDVQEVDKLDNRDVDAKLKDDNLPYKNDKEDDGCDGKEDEELDNSLKALLDTFLDHQGLELDGKGDELDDFIELFKNIVLPVVNKYCAIGKYESDVAVDDVKAKSNNHDNNNGLVENLKKLVKENMTLSADLRKLQNDKVVGNAKIKSLTEQLNQFKTIAANAGKRVLNVRNLESERVQLKENINQLTFQLDEAKKNANVYESRIDALKKTNQSNLDNLRQSLQEDYGKAKSDNANKLKEALNELADKDRLIEKYKNLAHDIANRYIDSKALSLGISGNEIRNRLSESYTLNDVDKVCQDLQDYSLNISKLPFSFDKPGSSAKIRVREDFSKDPLRNLEVQRENDIDDYTLDLASRITGQK